MVISRTPFRISFFGGGTDYPAFYRENGGAVLNTSINRYCYITIRHLPPFFDYKYRIRYSEREETQTVAEIKHPSARECLRFLQFENVSVEIQHNSDLPAMSGLGSSSAFTVGLLHGLRALQGKMTTKRQLALDAIHVEQDRIGENVGSQDQTTTAFGGFNRVDFGATQEIQVTPITIGEDKLEAFRRHLMLFFTGFPRMASEIAGEQIRQIPNKQAELRRMLEMVDEAIDILNDREERLRDFGKLLDKTWQIKRKLTSRISNSHLDQIYEAALRAGALGGKLLGAGGGGFMMFFVEPEFQPRVKEALKELLYVPFDFETLGSQIIYYAPNTEYVAEL